MDIFEYIWIGINTAASFDNLLYCFLGVLLGTLFGVIPGIGTMAALSMLFPFTYYLGPTTALIMLAGIWYGTTYGGSVASILLNLPGSTSSAVTCLDGYPMAQQSRAGVALLMTTVASFVGASIGILLLMIFTPTIARVALSLGATEYFSVMLFGLVAASTMSGGSAHKGLAMVVLGIVLGVVGIDVYTGTERFTFGVLDLTDGVSLIALAVGIFGVAEVIESVRRVDTKAFDPESISFRAMKPTRDDVRRSWMPMFRGSGIGAFFGALPGTGPAMAAFVGYAVEKRVAKDPSRFGNGAIEGIMAPEAANSAADQAAFIPTLSLGIPGSPSMALMLSALLIHGIIPGPNLIATQPSLFWGLIMSFWIGNILLVILNVPLIGIWVRILMIPYNLLFPSVIVFVCIGAYSVGYSSFDIWLVALFGGLGYLMRILHFPAAPLLLGFVLGPMMEEHFRRAMLLSRGDLMTFVESPISATVLGLTAALLLWSVVSYIKRRKVRPEKNGDAVS